jgi:ATP-binding cassette, subfamily A (ABC1), member 3
MDFTKFLYGFPLFLSQVYAMTMKKFLYSIRNYILLIIQFAIPALFVVITMLLEDFTSGDKDLPALPIGFDQYISTVSTVSKGSMAAGSTVEKIFKGYEEIFRSRPGDHQLAVTDKDFQDAILDQYKEFKSKTNLEFMVGASLNDEGITAWFNNQGYHTAPLAINLLNNVILKSFSENAAKSIRLINKPLPFTTSTRVSANLSFPLPKSNFPSTGLTTWRWKQLWLQPVVQHWLRDGLRDEHVCHVLHQGASHSRQALAVR